MFGQVLLPNARDSPAGVPRVGGTTCENGNGTGIDKHVSHFCTCCLYCNPLKSVALTFALAGNACGAGCTLTNNAPPDLWTHQGAHGRCSLSILFSMMLFIIPERLRYDLRPQLSLALTRQPHPTPSKNHEPSSFREDTAGNAQPAPPTASKTYLVPVPETFKGVVQERSDLMARSAGPYNAFHKEHQKKLQPSHKDHTRCTVRECTLLRFSNQSQ